MWLQVIYLLLTLMTALNSYGRNPFTLPKRVKILNQILFINYADASQVATELTSSNRFLSPRGKLVIDKRTNALWISDDTVHIEKIKQYLSNIDKPAQQIFIKAKIIMMDKHSLEELGGYFSFLSLQYPLVDIRQQKIFDVKLSALEQQGHIHVIAMPQLITNNRETATIESGEEVPYQEKTGEGNTTVAFKKAVLRLKVTPSLLPQKKILLKLTISLDKPSNILIQGVPSITTQQIKTQVVVANNKTLILGGITQHSQNTSVNGIPLLDRIPVLGQLLRSHQSDNNDKELMIFINPSLPPPPS